MDFLNNTFAQLSDLFRSMTPGVRITTALLLIVVVVSMGYLFHNQVSGPDLYLLGGANLPSSHIPVMEAAFAKAGLSSYEVEGTRIRVPRGQRSAYMGALADDNAMPPEWGKVLDDALQQESVFVSSEQRQARLRIAKQKELGLIIRSMSGIENAAVLYDTKTKRGFRRETVTTASVSVKPLGNEDLDDTRVLAIRHLVAGAIAGMKPENVTVTNLNGGRIFAGGPSAADSATQNAYRRLKRDDEERLKDKVLEALAYVPGVIATVNVELDKERMSRKESVKHGPKPIPVWTEEKSASRTREGREPGGRAGYTAQGNTPRTLASTSTSKGAKEDEEESLSEQHSVVDGERMVTDSVGHLPTRVTVVVGIPKSYFGSIWRKQNPAKEGEEPKAPDQAALDQIQQAEISKIKKHVAGLLPRIEGIADSSELVTVNPFEDMKQADIPVAGMGEKAVGWLGKYWGTLGMIGLAGFSLIMLRSMVLSSPADTERAPAGAAISRDDTVDIEDAREVAATVHRLARFTKGGPSLRDELSDVVKEDPEAAANILKAWIGNPMSKAS